MPAPDTRGSGSGAPTTTRAIPAAVTVSTHGGVRPWWEHGSRVTTSVPSRASIPAPASARTSAWGRPGRFMGGDGDQAPTGREDHGADPRVGMGTEPGGGLHGALHRPQPWLRPTDSVAVGARRHHALLLPSGLSPSVPEFHRVHPWSRSGSVGVAGFHRRSGISPCPEGGSVADRANATHRRRQRSGGHHGGNELRLIRCAGRSGDCIPGAVWRVPSSRRRRRTPPIVIRAGAGHWWPPRPRVRQPGAAAPRRAGP